MQPLAGGATCVPPRPRGAAIAQRDPQPWSRCCCATGTRYLFLGVALEGEAALLTAALLASRGLFRIPVVIAVAVAANSLADQLYFQLARARGRTWLEGRFGRHPRYPKLVSLVRRRGGVLLVASRFAYGLRVAIPAACGALGMGVLAFTLLDVLAGLLWTLPLVALGSAAGGALGPRLEGVRHYREPQRSCRWPRCCSRTGWRRAGRPCRHPHWRGPPRPRAR